MGTEVVYSSGDGIKNEDNFVVNSKDGIYAVIDGATGLGGLTGKLSSDILKEELERGNGSSLEYRVEQANTRLREEMVRLEGVESLEDIPKVDRSTSGFVAIELDRDKNRIRYIHGGDCMLFLEHEDKKVRKVTEDHLEYLDGIAISQLTKEVRKGYSLREARDFIKDTLRENRSTLNTYEGYGVLDGSEDVWDYLESGSVPLIRVESILMLSDGMVHPGYSVEDKTWEKTAKYVIENGLSSLHIKVWELEDGDRDLKKYPRFKKSDDKTGIHIKL